MKNIIFGIYLFAVTTVSSQQVSGKLEHFTSTSLSVRYSPDVITMTDDTIHVNGKGEFSFRFKMSCPAIVRLSLTNEIVQEIFMAPGHNLIIKADLASKLTYKNTLKFSGSVSKYNQFFLRLEESERFRSVDFYRNPDLYSNLSNEGKINLIKDYKLIKDSIRGDFFINHTNQKLATIFFKADSMETQYGLLTKMIMICNQFYTVDERMQFMKQYVTPFVADTNDPVIISGWWCKIGWNFYAHRMYFDAKAKGDTISPASTNEFERRFENLDRIAKSPLLIEMMYGHWYLNGMTSQYKFIDEKYFASWDSAFERMSKRIHSDELINKFRQTIEENKSLALLSKKGKPAPPFVLTDSSGQTYQLNDFIGKVMVLDIWASWCDPCIKEFPKMEKLQGIFVNRNDIVFLNISVDNFRKDWIEKGLRFSPPGISLWAANGTYGDFYKDYKIGTLPHIMILDKEGEFIEYSAPYPSDGDKLEKLIVDALKE